MNFGSLSLPAFRDAGLIMWGAVQEKQDYGM